MTAKTYVSRIDDHPEAVVDRIYNTLEELNASGTYSFSQRDTVTNEYETVVRFYSGIPPAQALEMNVDFEYATVSLFHNCRDTAAQEVLGQLLRDKIGFETDESLLLAAELDVTPRNMMRLWRGCRPQFNNRIGDVIRRGLLDSDPGVREATGLALVALKYTELLPDLEAAIGRESDDRARGSLLSARDAMT